MRNLLALVGAAVVTLAGAGYFLGWYKVGKAPGDGGKNVNIEVDTGKMGQDLHKGAEKLGDMLHQKDKGRGGEEMSELPPPPPLPAMPAAGELPPPVLGDPARDPNRLKQPWEKR
jgi:hypothetical protein